MSVVTTVTGDVPDDALGTVLPHEHLIANAVGQWRVPENDADLPEYTQPYGIRMRGDMQLAPFSYRDALGQMDFAVALEELAGLAALGRHTVAELSIPGFGRDAVALRALSIMSGVQIIMGCGEYVEPAHSAYLPYVHAEAIRDVLLKELLEGVGKTDVRAGIIGEIGTSNTPTDQELKVLTGSALAQRESGVALNIHRSIFPDPLGTLPAIDHVLELGVDPQKVVVSHVDERPEPEFALEAARRGVMVELDTFGMEQWAVSARSGDAYPRRADDDDRYDMLRVLLDAGHLDRILLSHDICMKPQFRAHGGWGLTHLTKNVEPRLRALGVSEHEIHTMRVVNPRRVLAHD